MISPSEPERFPATPPRRGAVLMTTCLLAVAAVAASRGAHAQGAPGASAPADPGLAALKEQLEAEIAAQRRRSEQIDAKLSEIQALGERIAAQEKRSEAQRSELLLTSVVGKGSGLEEKVRLYGFTDMGLQLTSFGDSSIANGAVQSRALTFAMGNINLYVDAQPFERWRALFEVRLTNYPNGSAQIPALGQPFNRTSTTVYDVTSPSGGWSQIQYGAIVMERAFIQARVTDWFNVRLGYWPTPYGIWNVDHGTPTRISLNEPQFIVADAFPSKQTGLDLTGTVALSSWELEYHAYVSNGRTPGQLSLINDKAVGGRLVLRTTAPVPVAIGASAYYGRFADIQTTLTTGTLVAQETTTEAFNEVAAAADVSVDWKRVRLRSELVFDQRRYDEHYHAPSPLGLGTVPSQTFWGTYLLCAYRIPWGGLEPYLYTELDKNLVTIAEAAGSLSAGLNIYFTPGVQLKVQYTHLVPFDFESVNRSTPAQSAINFYASRLVMAF